MNLVPLAWCTNNKKDTCDNEWLTKDLLTKEMVVVDDDTFSIILLLSFNDGRKEHHNENAYISSSETNVKAK